MKKLFSLFIVMSSVYGLGSDVVVGDRSKSVSKIITCLDDYRYGKTDKAQTIVAIIKHAKIDNNKGNIENKIASGLEAEFEANEVLCFIYECWRDKK